MGMYSYVKGVLNVDDEKFKKYKQIAKMCFDQDISFPKEVDEYFDQNNIDTIDLCNNEFEIDLPKDSYVEFSVDGSDIIEIDISKLSDNISKVRFINSY